MLEADNEGVTGCHTGMKENQMTDIEKLTDEFACDRNCPRNCCLESIGGVFTEGDYELLKQVDGKVLYDGSVFHLRESLESCEEGMRFRQDSNGVCMFFRDDHCMFHASFGRETEPYDCREYPRNILHFMGHTEKMLDPRLPSRRRNDPPGRHHVLGVYDAGD